MDKVGINNIKNLCASYMLLKKMDTCHFYRLGWKRFLQLSLKENYVQKDFTENNFLTKNILRRNKQCLNNNLDKCK
jgi:hypothetical protein